MLGKNDTCTLQLLSIGAAYQTQVLRCFCFLTLLSSHCWSETKLLGTWYQLQEQWRDTMPMIVCMTEFNKIFTPFKSPEKFLMINGDRRSKSKVKPVSNSCTTSHLTVRRVQYAKFLYWLFQNCQYIGLSIYRTPLLTVYWENNLSIAKNVVQWTEPMCQISGIDRINSQGLEDDQPGKLWVEKFGPY